MPATSDPPAPATGTLLVLDTSTLSAGRFYPLNADRNLPMFSIRSDNSAKHRSLHHGIDGSVVGEVAFHGMFKSGKGTVIIANSVPVNIEDWMPNGNAITIEGEVYEWTRQFIKNGNFVHSVFEAWRQKEVIARYTTLHRDANGMTRAHIIFADDVDIDKVVPTLLVSLIVFEHLAPASGKTGGGSSVGDAVAKAISVTLNGGTHV